MNQNVKIDVPESPRRIRLVRAVSLTVAALLVLGVCAFITPILMPKYLSVSPEGSLTREYYGAVAEGEHDVLFIGDCEVYESFVPTVLFEEYGITSYVRGGAQQLVWHSYYLLEDALRYETPRVVVYNVLALKYGEPQKEAYNRMALDGMAWSASKVAAIRASMTEEEDFLSYVFPLLRFHSRWQELGAEDFRYAFSSPPLVSDCGYLMQTGVVPYDPTKDLDPSPLVDPRLPATSMAYLDRMRELCAERGIELVLVKAPTNAWQYHWYDEWDAEVRDYAAENGLAYYNLIPEADAIGLDMSTDTYDGGVHLNVYGAEKLSRYFGAILQERHNTPDRRGESAFDALWQGRIEAYERRKQTA